ncbi:MAG: DUF4192 family protein [Actinomycetaceae bacterium]|nr:DUF4192 family protein [Actinomycetaceae bacterium]MDY6083079.1 DUF4192 family protein [Actinomycetaceae bacterium]
MGTTHEDGTSRSGTSMVLRDVLSSVPDPRVTNLSVPPRGSGELSILDCAAVTRWRRDTQDNDVVLFPSYTCGNDRDGNPVCGPIQTFHPGDSVEERGTAIAALALRSGVHDFTAVWKMPLGNGCDKGEHISPAEYTTILEGLEWLNEMCTYAERRASVAMHSLVMCGDEVAYVDSHRRWRFVHWADAEDSVFCALPHYAHVEWLDAFEHEGDQRSEGDQQFISRASRTFTDAVARGMEKQAAYSAIDVVLKQFTLDHVAGQDVDLNGLAVTPEMIGTMVAALKIVRVRDAFLAWALSGDRFRQMSDQQILRSLQRASERPINRKSIGAAIDILSVCAASVPNAQGVTAGCLAYVLWWSGQWDRARRAVVKAREHDATYTMARLMDDVLREGVAAPWMHWGDVNA